MKTISAPPGAAIFRLSLMIIIVAILVVIFFRYVDDSQLELERRSIIQTKTIIDSALAVAFASYAVKGRLDQLNDLDGGNPFVFLDEYEILPAAYRGEIDGVATAGLEPGWYYARASGDVIYVPRFLDRVELFRLVLNYEDLDGSGAFEAARDRFQNLQFIKKPRP